ncbi:MAG: alanine dehydrogenase [Spirochaetaceae bacterium]|jgi:alanine dehydrogenase|nr:alanine dehydrogenase [Spirochaetaceae bacterium]
MKIGCVTEIKKHEYRSGMTPDNVETYRANGHEVFIQKGAGLGASFTDDDYRAKGAVIIESAGEIWAASDMIIKVKEPLEAEYPLIRRDQILYTYLHLAPNRPLTDALLASGAKAVAYETVRDAAGRLPLLKPMSEVAGRLSIQEGAKYLEGPMGGRGVLLGGVPGVPRARVLIVGGGVVGLNACKMAAGAGAAVTILDSSAERLAYLDDIFGQRIQTLYSQETVLEKALYEADLVIGAVLIPGAAAPKLIKRKYLANMKKGGVIVDVAVDQGGCAETTKPTYHDDPVYTVDGVIHYCVANMPGAVARTSTIALTNATLRYGLAIANNGLENAARADGGLALGINCYRGLLTCREAAESLNLPYADSGASWNS